jgi:hypothetical protein
MTPPAVVAASGLRGQQVCPAQGPLAALPDRHMKLALAFRADAENMRMR